MGCLLFNTVLLVPLKGRLCMYGLEVICLLFDPVLLVPRSGRSCSHDPASSSSRRCIVCAVGRVVKLCCGGSMGLEVRRQEWEDFLNDRRQVVKDYAK
jgi:hypothetical protein